MPGQSAPDALQPSVRHVGRHRDAACREGVGHDALLVGARCTGRRVLPRFGVAHVPLIRCPLTPPVPIDHVAQPGRQGSVRSGNGSGRPVPSP